MINYPQNPNVGDEFDTGTVTFMWDGVKWKAVTVGGRTIISYANTESMQNSRPTQTGQRVENRERANAQYVLADSGYTAKPGDITAANGRVWELVISGDADIRWFGAAGDGVIDDTSAFQSAIDRAIEKGSSVYIPSGVFLLGHCKIPSSVLIRGEWQSSILKRISDFDANNVNEDLETNAHFAITSGDVSVSFSGITFDGNESNQSANVPRGQSIQFSSNTGSGVSTISVENCTFKNQTHYAIKMGGLDNTNELQILTVRNCSFIDGKKGVGSGDPLSENALGFAPWAIQVTDHVEVSIHACKFIYTKPLAATREYAPSGVRFTFLNTSTNEDGPSGTVTNCYFYRYGRKDEDYLGNPTGNNGLGCIDFYGRAREIVISNNRFEFCLNSGVRGKSNVSNASISGNEISNTPLAINIGPNTFDNQLGDISITGNAIRDSREFGIGVVGNSMRTPSFIDNVSISGNTVSSVTNEDLVEGNAAGIHTRHIKNVSITGNSIRNCTGQFLSGIKCRNVQDATITGNTVDNVTDRGIYINGVVGSYNITGNTVKNTGLFGVSIDSSTSDVSGVISSNVISDCTDYGIINVSALDFYTVTSNNIRNVSGLSRGIFVPSVINSIVSSNITDASLPLFNSSAGGATSELLNSWNQKHDHGNGIPASGAWMAGDIVWDTSPSAGANVGWVCVTTGEYGTASEPVFKAFGTIEV